jgi:histidine ammonia-lyase
MLVDNPQAAGINSGLMMPQYTAASLVLENQTLATPDSIRSLPTSAGQEDHNANAMTAARHTYEIIENLRQILSIEIYTAIRAIELRNRISEGKLGEGTKAVYEKIRKVVTYKESDTLWGQEILKINEMIKDQSL